MTMRMRETIYGKVLDIRDGPNGREIDIETDQGSKKTEYIGHLGKSLKIGQEIGLVYKQNPGFLAAAKRKRIGEMWDSLTLVLNPGPDCV